MYGQSDSTRCTQILSGDLHVMHCARRRIKNVLRCTRHGNATQLLCGMLFRPDRQTHTQTNYCNHHISESTSGRTLVVSKSLHMERRLAMDPEPNLVMDTDASKRGWGASCLDVWSLIICAKNTATATANATATDN